MKTILLLSVLYVGLAVSTPCGTDTCASDEVCNSTPACQCNSTYYKNTGSNPVPNITCDGGKFNIQVSKCWLEKNGYNSGTIRLNSTTSGCSAVREVVNGIAQMGIHRPLISTDCNTVADANTTHITYRNQLYIYAKTTPIQTRKDIVINLSCTYPAQVNVTLNVTLRPIIGTTVISGPDSNATFTVNMVAYKDSQFSVPLSESDPLYVEDVIYISVVIPDLDSNTLKLKVLKITAAPDNTTTDSHVILENGCPSPNVPEGLIIVNSNGINNEARFTMKVFQIAGFSTVRLSADVFLCKDNCATTCAGQGKAARAQESAGTVTMYLNADERYYDTSSASGFSMPWTLPALIFSWILVKFF